MTRKKKIALAALLELADHAYGDDGLVLDAARIYRKKGWRLDASATVGDLLATFVATELAETFDPKAFRQRQLEEAWRVMDRAARQLQRVAAALLHQQIEDGQSDRAFTLLGRSILTEGGND